MEECNGTDQMTEFNLFIDTVNSNIDDMTLNKKEVNEILNKMGIDKRYQIPINEFIGILKEKYKLKEFGNLRSMLKTYDYYNNGYASIYQIKKVLSLKYDKFGQYQFVKQIIARQQPNSAGMINVCIL